MTEKIRVGVFGGTFNPPHLAHVNAAEHFAEAAGLDRLLVIPALLPPHKEYSGTVEPNERIEMCRLAFSHIKNTEVSDIEIARGGKSYTAITLSELKSDNNELFLLCGTDMFLTLDSWYMPEKIFELATVCYIRRESDTDITEKIEDRVSLYKQRYGARILAVNASAIELSSTLIREELKANKGSQYLPPAVYEYIKGRGLYV
ncbi:MAG: nicotinate (nicotinamide) nucleotide adenylyltransferase [Clostridia bacterium]|nr:nicotinate (nicotinamide) nucleotide adenylyltransferase [Clostridia bacterium]